MELGKTGFKVPLAWHYQDEVLHFQLTSAAPETLDKDFSGKDWIYAAGTKSNGKKYQKACIWSTIFQITAQKL